MTTENKQVYQGFRMLSVVEPHFACLMHILPARKPLEEVQITDECYRSWFA